MSQGSEIAESVRLAQIEVSRFGKWVFVDGKDTLEVMNFSFVLKFENRIDLNDISEYASSYYESRGLNFETILSFEKDEYGKIFLELSGKFKLFEEDLRSRRVLWTDDCCISVIHFLIRREKIYCFVVLRSSDCVVKLFSDVYFVCSVIENLQKAVNINKVEVNFSINSLHRIFKLR